MRNNVGLSIQGQDLRFLLLTATFCGLLAWGWTAAAAPSQKRGSNGLRQAALTSSLSKSAASTATVTTEAAPSEKKWSVVLKHDQKMDATDVKERKFEKIQTDGSALVFKYKLTETDSIAAVQKFNFSIENGVGKLVWKPLGVSLSRSELTQVSGNKLAGAITYYAPTGEGSEVSRGKNEVRTAFSLKIPVAAKTALSLGAQQRYYFYTQDLQNDLDRYLFITGADLGYELNPALTFNSSIGHAQAKKLFPGDGKPSQTDGIFIDVGVSLKVSSALKMSLYAEQLYDLRGEEPLSMFKDSETAYHLVMEASL